LGSGVSGVTLGGTVPIRTTDNTGNNAIVGNDGDNVITVTGGADAVHGGLGQDRLAVDYRLATGAITGDSTTNFTEAGGGARSVTITAGTFEDFTVLTGSGADTLTVGDGRNVIQAGSGANTITAGNGVNSIIGGQDADTITAGNGGNVIEGGDGANTITSGTGDDVIGGGTGADTVIAGGGNDVITVAGGADNVDGGAGADRLVVDYSGFTTNVRGAFTGGNLGSGYTGLFADLSASRVDFVATESFKVTTGLGNDVVKTGDGDDMLVGDAGEDTLDGRGGDDVLFGGADDDSLKGGVGSDALAGETGIDRVLYNDSLTGLTVDLHVASNNTGIAAGDTYVSIENLLGSNLSDNLRGDAGKNAIWGQAGNDTILGRDGNDRVDGGAGDDWLNGGAGKDTLIGGVGNDTFAFTRVGDTVVGASRDQIADFASGDRLDLTGMEAETGTAFNFIEAAAVSDTAGEVRQFSSGGGTYIAGDVDGNSTQDFQIRLTGAHTLTDSSFV
jgi:Ca2+-binding RTX toxin-like protein